jgi:hypothetical protein
LLSYLACLPSDGVDLAIMERLTNGSEATVKALIQECSMLKNITLIDQKVRFVHEKLHAAARTRIDAAERPRLLLMIAREVGGLSTDYRFLQADMLLSAYELNPELVSRREVAMPGKRPTPSSIDEFALNDALP